MSDRDDDDIFETLRQRDEASRAERVGRITALQDICKFEHGVMFKGGTISTLAFADMEASYVNGAYLACIVTAQIVLKHEIAALMEMHGDEISERLGFADICKKAVEAGYLDAAESSLLEQLRKSRNPYVHIRSLFGNECFERRIAETMRPPWELAEEDATTAIRIVYKMMSRRGITL